MRISRFAPFAFVVASLALVAPAFAYIPPSQFIVKKMAAKRGGYKGFRVKSNVVGLNGKDPSGAVFQEITVVDLQAKVLKSRALDETGHELFAVERSLAHPKDLPLADSILFESKGDHLANVLKAAGLPVRTEDELMAMADEEERRRSESEWLERIPGGVVWAIGTDRKSDSKPQLWIEKDTFLPVRLMSRHEGDFADLHFENYRTFREFPYPRQIHLLVGGTDIANRALRDDVVEVSVSPEPAELKVRMQSGYTDAGNAAPSAVRDLIRKYYQFVR